MPYVSRAGEKLEHALAFFKINPTDLICADFGCSTGGFTDCLLQKGAKCVYAVDTGYGVLDWKLRKDNRVIVMERVNAIHLILPEKVDLICIDTGWTKSEKIIPNALSNLKSGGIIIILIKPHYEAERYMLINGKVKDEHLSHILENVVSKISNFDLEIISKTKSPLLGKMGKNKEFLLFAQKPHKQVD